MKCVTIPYHDLNKKCDVGAEKKRAKLMEKGFGLSSKGKEGSASEAHEHVT